MSTTPVRVPHDIHANVTQLAALRGVSPGQLLAEAWREYFEAHRHEFADDIEEAARLMRDGTLDDLVAFAGRGNNERAAAAAARLRQTSE